MGPKHSEGTTHRSAAWLSSRYRAQNGRGLVLLPKGQTLGENGDTIRWGEPDALNPDGYFRYYNSQGQPLNPATGQRGPNSATHIPSDSSADLIPFSGRLS